MVYATNPRFAEGMGDAVEHGIIPRSFTSLTDQALDMFVQKYATPRRRARP